MYKINIIAVLKMIWSDWNSLNVQRLKSRWPYIRLLLINAMSQKRLEEISSDLAKTSTWSRGWIDFSGHMKTGRRQIVTKKSKRDKELKNKQTQDRDGGSVSSHSSCISPHFNISGATKLGRQNTKLCRRRSKRRRPRKNRAGRWMWSNRRKKIKSCLRNNRARRPTLNSWKKKIKNWPWKN